ncbi:MAG: EAL domain-containing protein [Rhodospirillales bacterium]|nr:EAL domain-containing protein [Rhodospirillales bacterium]
MSSREDDPEALKFKDKEKLRNSMDVSSSLSHAWAHNVDRQSMLRTIERWYDESQGNTGFVLVAGINRMYMFNEALGASVADELIVQTGVALKDVVGHMGDVVRIDGNTFCMLFSDDTQNDIETVSRYILNYFYEAPVKTKRGDISVNLSIGGIVLDRQQSMSPAAVLTKAESAMRAAKEQRFSCFVSYENMANRTDAYRDVLSQGEKFVRALKENRVRLAYQPIVKAGKENVVFNECLIRMVDERGKVLAAAEFLPAIELLGLSHLADQFALQTALQELVQYPDLGLSINVSHMSLHNPEWLSTLERVLKNRPGVAERLVVELTESAMMGDHEKTVEIVRKLHNIGCRVALDDFGSGYTTFAQIKDLSVDFLKIDKSYIRNIQDDKNRLFVRTLQALADGLGVETIGEGAETIGDVKILSDDGISNIQGYAFGLPLVERIWLPEGHEKRNLLRKNDKNE